jgi:hypothetical protein
LYPVNLQRSNPLFMQARSSRAPDGVPNREIASSSSPPPPRPPFSAPRRAAHASNVHWSVGIDLPPVTTVVGNGPAYYPAPVYGAPAYYPEPVYYAAPSYSYYPAPVYYAPRVYAPRVWVGPAVRAVLRRALARSGAQVSARRLRRPRRLAALSATA